jgi:hypothetical protein
MNKYIDAERLKAKLDEHYRKYQSKYMETRVPYTQGLIDALDLAEQVIDALQQEQSEVDLEKETKQWWKEHLHLNPENQLWMDAHQSIVFARHFYELGLKARKEE